MWQRLLGWMRSLLATQRAGQVRVSGPPRSANGASSLHLWWDLPEIPLREVAVTLEILEPPQVSKLYFFALQASFIRRVEPFGGAHLGLQWNSRHPDSRAVNWGGYDDAGTILTGTRSPLPSTPTDPNTRDFPWQPGRPYRLQIGPASGTDAGLVAWPGTVTDLMTGERTLIRELHTGGDALRAPVMWMEVFADCDDPSVAIKWTDLVAVATDGTELRPHGCRVTYQRYQDGGCTNTSAAATAGAFIQRTNTDRVTPPDAVLTLQ